MVDHELTNLDIWREISIYGLVDFRSHLPSRKKTYVVS